MTSETAAIEKTLWTYLDGLHEGDAEKIAAAFHPVSHLYSETERRGRRCPARQMARHGAQPAVGEIARAARATTAS